MYISRPSGGGVSRSQAKTIAKSAVKEALPTTAFVDGGIGANAVTGGSTGVVSVFGKFGANVTAAFFMQGTAGSITVTGSAYAAGSATVLDQLDVTLDATGASTGQVGILVVYENGVVVGTKVINVI